MGKKKVSYFHDADTIGSYYYGPGHPMKPHRLQMTHNLILSYHLYKKMEVCARSRGRVPPVVRSLAQSVRPLACAQVFRPHLATADEMMAFHSPEYIDFVRRVTPDNQHDFSKQLQRFTVGDDCPVRTSSPRAPIDGTRVYAACTPADALTWVHRASRSLTGCTTTAGSTRVARLTAR